MIKLYATEYVLVGDMAKELVEFVSESIGNVSWE